MKAKDLILVALVCANVTLASVAAAVYLGQSEPAAMAGTSMRYGDYLLVTGSVTTSREALLVIDVLAKRANLYVPDAGAGKEGPEFKLTCSRNLATDFSGGAAVKPTR